MSSYVGFANLPNQVHRKTVKRGFEFTLMVVGESGLGKSTLVNSLFLTDLYADKIRKTANERVKSTLEIKTSSVEIEERGVKLKLTVVDTPGFADSIDCTESFIPIKDYIEQQFENYLNDESGLNRRNITDNRVHCCFYFINPSGHGLRPVDIKFMQLLHERVNIVPVIGKADTLTKNELLALKSKVISEIRERKIKIYNFPDCDEDEEDEEFKQLAKELKMAVPYAVVGSNCIIDIKGKKVRGRQYPWGVVEIENPAHSDFVKLRTMLITYMQDLKEVTQDYHYENYRAQRLSTPPGTPGSKPKRVSSEMHDANDGSAEDKDQMLKAKELELRRMQEMIEKMQLQMKQGK
ncbi:septin-1 isoform X2 [Hydra vulgaris]|uniref:Septin-1 isoform X2 n=1 Tax=Hydra vulgaris TaxID=6087 RepID=A0ABM4CPS4_HYDVU